MADDDFIWDTGSPLHIVNKWSLLLDFVKSPITLYVFGRSRYISQGYGKINANLPNGEEIIISKVWYIAASNIISAKRGLEERYA